MRTAGRADASNEESIFNEATDVLVQVQAHAWDKIRQLPDNARLPALVAGIIALSACDAALEIGKETEDIPADARAHIQRARYELAAFLEGDA